MRFSYIGINRDEYPDWLGWLILDLLDSDTRETEEHIREIKTQLDYEVKHKTYLL